MLAMINSFLGVVLKSQKQIIITPISNPEIVYFRVYKVISMDVKYSIITNIKSSSIALDDLLMLSAKIQYATTTKQSFICFR